MVKKEKQNNIWDRIFDEIIAPLFFQKTEPGEHPDFGIEYYCGLGNEKKSKKT